MATPLNAKDAKDAKDHEVLASVASFALKVLLVLWFVAYRPGARARTPLATSVREALAASGTSGAA